MLAPVGGEAEDPLGLDVESSGGGGFPEEQLQASLFLVVSVSVSVTWKQGPSSPHYKLLHPQEMFPESSGEIGSERFDPAYFLLEHHHNTTFDDLKVTTEFQFSSSLNC